MFVADSPTLEDDDAVLAVERRDGELAVGRHVDRLEVRRRERRAGPLDDLAERRIAVGHDVQRRLDRNIDRGLVAALGRRDDGRKKRQELGHAEQLLSLSRKRQKKK